MHVGPGPGPPRLRQKPEGSLALSPLLLIPPLGPAFPSLCGPSELRAQVRCLFVTSHTVLASSPSKTQILSGDRYFKPVAVNILSRN